MPPQGNNLRISSGEYEHLCEIGVAFEGIVELENGLLLYVYCEAAVIGHFENKHHISYGTSTKSYEVPVCPQDNTRVNTQNQGLPILPVESTGSKNSKSDIEYKVRNELINKLSDFTKGRSRRPVNERLTVDDKYYGSLHDKIENGTIKRSDFERSSFDQSLIHALRKEIDLYFVCFDPINPNYKAFWGIYESPFGCAEDWIPVWGQAKLASESLNRGLNGYGAGYYFYAVGYFLLGVADLCSFGMESAIAKGLNTAGKAISGVFAKKAVANGGNYTYRALTASNAKSLAAGKGIFAKAPNGTWTLEEHLIHGSNPKALLNNPWIATSTDINIAKSFSSGNGIIRIDLSKIPKNSIQIGWQILPRSSPGYHFSIWQQEISILKHIPQEAIQIIK